MTGPARKGPPPAGRATGGRAFAPPEPEEIPGDKPEEATDGDATEDVPRRRVRDKDPQTDEKPGGGAFRAVEVMNPSFDVVLLDAAEAAGRLRELCGVLADCVNGGASVNFMLPFDEWSAVPFWIRVIDEVARGDRMLIVALEDGVSVGCVQLVLGMPPNQMHRAEVTKLLVRRSARGRGVGEALMRRCEVEAGLHGRTLLTLDTAIGSPAERLYRRLGWREVGSIPGYALFPDGEPCDTVLFWKRMDHVHLDDDDDDGLAG